MEINSVNRTSWRIIRHLYNLYVLNHQDSRVIPCYTILIHRKAFRVRNEKSSREWNLSVLELLNFRNAFFLSNHRSIFQEPIRKDQRRELGCSFVTFRLVWYYRSRLIGIGENLARGTIRARSLFKRWFISVARPYGSRGCTLPQWDHLDNVSPPYPIRKLALQLAEHYFINRFSDTICVFYSKPWVLGK